MQSTTVSVPDGEMIRAISVSVSLRPLPEPVRVYTALLRERWQVSDYRATPMPRSNWSLPDSGTYPQQ